MLPGNDPASASLDRAAGRPPANRRRLPLHTKILLGLCVGAALGIGFNQSLGGEHPATRWIVSHITEPVGQLFLRLLLMIVVPLVFSSLLLGIAGIGDLRKLGRVGFKSFGYCLVLSFISVVIGIGLANLIQPGRHLSPGVAQQLQERYASEAGKVVEKAKQPGASATPLMQVVTTLIPKNPIAAVAGETPNMLHLMFFTLLLGIAVTLVPRPQVAGFLSAMEGLYALSARIIDLMMVIAPVAVAALLFTNTALFGFELLKALVWFVVTVLLGLGLHMFGVYSLSVKFLSGLSPIDFFWRIRTAMITAFSTSSSNATLPTALKVGEEELGVPREINSFVLTVGATANQNGTALYEGVTVLFLAQLAGVELSLAQQITVAYLAILGGIGTAGVPSGSIPFIALVLASIGVNPSLIAIILGVDRVLDMCRTTLNVTGDLTAATYVARSESRRSP